MRSTPAALHVEPGIVRFQDVDAAGIVFYARIFDYFHDAYVAFLRTRGLPLEDALRDRSWVAPLRRAEADYHRPLRFADPFEVILSGLDVAETEFTVEYRIEKGGETMCTGRTVHVSVDPARFTRSALPDRLRRALEGEPPG